MNKRVLLKLASLLAIFVAIPSTLAHSPSHSADADNDSLTGLVKESALIFHGQVVDIQYRNSEPTREQPQGLPHTFVTYKVMDVLRGKVSDETLTLRIPGGADGQGGIYMDTSSPVFARKQTDVLFVKGGESGNCPLVDCVEGRFRIAQNQVFNAWGVPVVDARRQIKVGGRPRFDLNVMDVPQPTFEQLMQRPDFKQLLEKRPNLRGQSLANLKERYEKEAPKFLTVSYGIQSQAIRGDQVEGPEAEVIEKYGKPLSTQSFLGAIKEVNQRIGESRTPVFSAQIDKPFRVEDPKLDRLSGIQAPKLNISDEQRNDKQAQEEDQQ